MRVIQYAPDEPVHRDRLNSNTVARLEQIGSLRSVLAVLDGLRAEHAPARLLCTLDDVNQCAYTSMHAAEDDRLYHEPGDVDEPDPAAQRVIDDARAAHVAGALAAAPVDWAALAGSRAGAGADGDADVAALAECNRDPDQVLDEVVLVQRVPVADGDLAIAGIPNGYFAGDWDTFANHAVIRRMATHGYRLIGVGAALLGFDRPAAPTADEVAALLADLVHLYGSPQAEGWAELAGVLTGSRVLLLGYVEDFAELVS